MAQLSLTSFCGQCRKDRTADRRGGRHHASQCQARCPATWGTDLSEIHRRFIQLLYHIPGLTHAALQFAQDIDIVNGPVAAESLAATETQGESVKEQRIMLGQVYSLVEGSKAFDPQAPPLDLEISTFRA